MRLITLKNCSRTLFLWFSSDGTRLLVIVVTKKAGVEAGVSIDVASGEEIGRVTFASPTCYNVDPAVTRLVIGGDTEEGDEAALRWIAVPGGTEWHEIDMGGVGRVCDAVFARTGNLFAATSATRVPRRARERCKVDVFRFPPGKAPRRIASMPTARPAGLVHFNAAGTRLAVTAGLGGEDDFEVFDVKAKRRVFRFDPKVPDRRAMAFLPDDRLVAAAGPRVYIIPATGGKPEFVLGSGKALVNDVAVSADGRRIIAARNNGAIEVWAAGTGAPGPRFDWGVGSIYAIALAPDGLTCAASGSKGRLVIWDVDA